MVKKKYHMSKLKAGLMVICNLIHRIKISHEINIKKDLYKYISWEATVFGTLTYSIKLIHKLRGGITSLE